MDLDRLMREILSLSPDGLVVVDREQRVVVLSPGAERIFGWRSDEMIGQPLDALLPDSVRPAHRRHIEVFEASEGAPRRMGDRGRIVGRRRDGTEFPAEASISRIELDGKRFFAAMIRDVSDRDRDERSLRASQSALAEAQRLARVGSWDWDVDADVVHCSDESYRLFGRPVGSLLRYADFLERLHPDDRDATDAAVQEAVRDGGVYERDYRIVLDGGAVRVLHGHGHVVRDGEGRTRMIGTAQDVTERRAAEERARELARAEAAREAAQAAAARFEFLVEASDLLNASLDILETLRSVTRLTVPGIADWCSLDLVEDGELRRVEVAHADPEKVRLAHDLHRRYPPDTSGRTPAAAALRRGESLLIEDFSDAMIDAIATDEAHRDIMRELGFRSAMCVPLVARGHLVGLITLATAESGRRFDAGDLSLVKSLADRAANAIDNARLFEQAKAAAEAREDALATVSHDLRSPLGVIGANVSLLLEPDLPESERARSLDRMARAAAAMQRMIDDLLEVTRLEGGGVALRCRSCGVEELIHGACELQSAAAAQRSIRFDVRVEPRLYALADSDRIVQVLGNLVNNAVRHSPEGGSVRVSARGVEDAVVLSVVDEGPGVPTESRDRIFQRFWQNESRKRGAAGLGLAIARALVELHGGRIWVEDAPRGGACFRFTLPKAAPDPA